MTVIKSAGAADSLRGARAPRFGVYVVRRKCAQPERTTVAKEPNV